MKNIAGTLQKMLTKPAASNKVLAEYEPSGVLKTFGRANVDLNKTQLLFKIAQTELGKRTFNLNTYTAKFALVATTAIANANLDLNSSTQKLIKIVEESEMRLNSKNFVAEVKA